MDVWKNLTYDQFEDLAYDFVKSIAPDWIWKPTKKTRDGSRDGESKIIEIDNPFGGKIEKEAWYEA